MSKRNYVTGDIGWFDGLGHFGFEPCEDDDPGWEHANIDLHGAHVEVHHDGTGLHIAELETRCARLEAEKATLKRDFDAITDQLDEQGIELH